MAACVVLRKENDWKNLCPLPCVHTTTLHRTAAILASVKLVSCRLLLVNVERVVMQQKKTNGRYRPLATVGAPFAVDSPLAVAAAFACLTLSASICAGIMTLSMSE